MHSLHRRVLHLSISAGFGFSCYLRDVLLRAVGIRPKIPATIIYYHVVPYEQRKRFATQMDALLRRAEVVRADVSSPLTPMVRYVAVTFDDGSETVLTNAFPELEKRQIPFTVFMITGMFGQSVSWERSPERLMSVDELRKLSKSDLVTIGSHTVSHPMLPRLVDSSALAELRNSKEQLQALIGREVTLFCFPYGGFTTGLVEWCRDVGYKRVFTTLPGNAFDDPKEFACGRVRVDPTDWACEFHLKIIGAYRWLPQAIAIKRKLALLLGVEQVVSHSASDHA